jgi:hypothetical protein
MIANHYQTLGAILFMPPPQRGDHPLAVYSPKCPHINENDFAAQIFQAQWLIDIQPNLIK